MQARAEAVRRLEAHGRWEVEAEDALESREARRGKELLTGFDARCAPGERARQGALVGATGLDQEHLEDERGEEPLIGLDMRSANLCLREALSRRSSVERRAAEKYIRSAFSCLGGCHNTAPGRPAVRDHRQCGPDRSPLFGKTTF